MHLSGFQIERAELAPVNWKPGRRGPDVAVLLEPEPADAHATAE